MKRINKSHWLVTIPIAHRGLHSCDNQIPENSLLAFKKAINNNYTIELDVQLSKDNKLIVFHDYNLERVCGLNKNISDLTFTELQNLSLFNTNQKIPLLEDVIELVSDKVPLLIEIKNESKIFNLEKKLNELLINYKGRFAIQSFNPFSLNWFYNNNPRIIRGQLSSKFKDISMNFLSKFILKNLLLNFKSKPDFIAYNIDDLPYKKISKLRKKIIILSWTVNSKDKLRKAMKFSDNYIFECLTDHKL